MRFLNPKISLFKGKGEKLIRVIKTICIIRFHVGYVNYVHYHPNYKCHHPIGTHKYDYIWYFIQCLMF